MKSSHDGFTEHWPDHRRVVPDDLARQEDTSAQSPGAAGPMGYYLPIITSDDLITAEAVARDVVHPR